MAVIKKVDFSKAVAMCRQYDAFPQYIENYNQMNDAIKANNQLNDSFAQLMVIVGVDVDHIPDQLINAGAQTESALTEWLSDNDVTIEQDQPKQKRVWSEDEIKNLIQTNDKVLYGALKKLYNCQTTDEQRDGTTKEYNGVGFNGVDAPILTSFAQFLIKTGFLTDKQKVLARKKLIKYNKQLTKLANQ